MTARKEGLEAPPNLQWVGGPIIAVMFIAAWYEVDRALHNLPLEPLNEEVPKLQSIRSESWLGGLLKSYARKAAQFVGGTATTALLFHLC